MYCKRCGKKLSDDALFCEMCGTRVSALSELGENEYAAASSESCGENSENASESAGQVEKGSESVAAVENAGNATAHAPEIPGQSQGTASLVLGILSIVGWFFGYSAILSFILGLIGIVEASKSKRIGYYGGTRIAGLVLSIIGFIGGAVILCIALFAIGLFASFIELLEYSA